MGLTPSATPTTGSGRRRPTLPIVSGLATRRHGCRREPRLHPTRRAPPAEVSRARGQPAFAARRLPSGVSRVRDARSAGCCVCFETPRPRRELRPNPIRSDTSCRAIAAHQMENLMQCGPRCLLAEASWCGEPPSITPREPSRSRMNASATGPRGPARDPLARITTNSAEGRFTRASAKKSEIGCTRGAFHRRATQTR